MTDFSLTRRHLLKHLGLFCSIGSTATLAKNTQLQKARHLQALGDALALKRQPLVLLASLPNCPYCEWARKTHLLPLMNEGALSAYQLDTTDTGPMVDFAGLNTTPARYLKELRIHITPTVLFLNAAGKEIAPRLEGVSIPDFYGAYLEERLALAKKALG